MRTLHLRALVLLGILLIAAPAVASHFRGGNVNVQVDESGVATFTYETLWRKGRAFFPFDGVRNIRLYDESDTSRSFALRSVFVDIGQTTVFRDVSDPAFDFRRQVVVLDLAGLGLPQGRYLARWESCCRIAGLQNAPESSFSLEALVIFDGTANGSPLLNSRILTVVGKGLPYDQNLNAFDPDGKPLAYDFLVGAFRPTFGPSFNIPGITLDGEGQVFISPFDTANLVSVNPRNPAGDYVFKVRVRDADGAFSERDVLLDVVETDNLPPAIDPVGDRVIDVGESLVLPVTATDPNIVDRVTLSTSALPANGVFVTSPGNPASGTLAFRPDASQVGTFGINLEARDDGTPVLTTSELVRITVLDPSNGCPVLAPVGNRNLVAEETLSFTLSASDPEGQPLTFSASFLPPGAVFDPATATFTWTPTEADSGVHLGTVFEVRDSASPPCSDRETVGFSVAPANRFPVLDPVGDRSAAEGSMITFAVTASDPDGDAVTLDAEPLPLGADFDPATGAFMWRPTVGQAGVYQVTFSAADNGTPTLSDQETIRITVGRSGEEAIRFVGAEEGQVVSGTVILEARVTSDFPVERVEFALDGEAVNQDLAAPYFLGGDVDGVPAGFDTSTLDDGLHVVSATATDSAGQTTTAQLKLTFRNFVPPVVERIDGALDGGVVSGTVFIEAEVSDDRQVTSVEFLIDGESAGVETREPFFLGGIRFPSGTFDVSCDVCLQVGDSDGDLVVADIQEDGTLAQLCAAAASSGTVSTAAVARRLTSLDSLTSATGTPDGETPAEEEVCDGFSGRAFGLCNAFCEAQDCDGEGVGKASCEELRLNFSRLTDESRFPCEEVGACIDSLTLALVDDPTRFATFGREDFTGRQTTFELPFAIPLGFDTTLLADGLHTLTVVVTDNLGLTSTEEFEIFVQNTLPPDALAISIVDPADGLVVEEGRVLPVTAQVSNAQGPVTVRFFAGGLLVTEDSEPPFETAVLVPGGTSAYPLDAVAVEDRGLRQAETVTLSVVPRPSGPAPFSVVDVSPESSIEERVAVDSALRISWSREVDPATLSGVRLFAGDTEVPATVELEAGGVSALVTPVSPMVGDTIHRLVVDDTASVDGAVAPRFSESFLTFPDIAVVTGVVLDTTLEPIPGLTVRVGDVSGVTDEVGAFRLEGVPTGPQVLHVDGGVVNGLTYPDLAFDLEVAEGIEENGLEEPVFLPALALEGGLDVVDGAATGSGILTASQLSGMSIDLRGITVENPDGTPFTGRMSITTVPPPNVPMEGLPGFSSNTYISVQPGSLRLVPPAPITYPNLDDALPGEQVPLSHFDHDVGDWVIYGTATVSADASSITSNPGEGLPKTGWGCPHPPNTFTTVVGTVVDKDGSPLHGVRVASGSVRGLTEMDGSFRLENVPAGREGTPRQITVQAIARDIESNTYDKTTPSKTAVQDGTTDFGEVKIDEYGPLVGDRIVLHGDFGSSSQNHFLKKGSSHRGEERYKAEVEELQKRLRDLGFRQGGSTRDHGDKLAVDGDYGDNSKKAVRLFQTLEFENGGAIGKLGGDGVVGPMTIERLNEISATILWGDFTIFAGIDHGCPSFEIADGYSTLDLGRVLFGLPVIAANDASNASGGDHPDHGSHETGIDVDIPLPRTDTNGCPANPSWGGGVTKVYTTSSHYDRDTMRTILQRAIDTGGTTRRWVNDSVLCAETHRGQSLCTFKSGHDDHLHIRISPEAVLGGVRAATSPLTSPSTATLRNRAAAGAADESFIRGVLAPGAGPSDVPVDATLLISLREAFDPTTLTAATVRVDSPDVAVQGAVIPDPTGLAVRFEPTEELDFATPHTVTLTSGAVLADGILLTQPSTRSFVTEGASSLRVTGATPRPLSEAVGVDTSVEIALDGRVDPTTLGPSSVAFLDERSGAAVPVEIRVSADGKRIELDPVSPLEGLTPYSVTLSPDVRGEDGSAVAGNLAATTFTTGLPPGLERVEIAPAEVSITRADLSEVFLSVTGFFTDGTTVALTSPVTGGTDYGVDRPDVVTVDADGMIVPNGNGEALLEVTPALPGFAQQVRVRVVDVFPEVTFVGRQFGLGADDDVVLEFSEPVDAPPVRVDSVEVADTLGNPVSGVTSFSTDGRTLTFDPDFPLPLRRDFVLRFDLDLTDSLGVTRVFPRRIRFATAAANLGFELGDFTDFAVTGDAAVVSSFGPLVAPEGDFMARLTTSDTAVDGATSTLQALDLSIPQDAQRLVFTYNFLTDEIEQGQPFNDFFEARLVMPDGSETVLIRVTRDQLFFSGQISPVSGFDRMTGFRISSSLVDGMGGETCDLILEVQVSDAGDTSIDSAVLIDDIHFE